MEDFSGIIGIILIIIAAVISSRKKKNNAQVPPPAPRPDTSTVSTSTGSTARRTPAPPRPSNTSPSVPTPVYVGHRVSGIYDYPKCPVCRSRNIRGEERKVFFSPETGGYRCMRNHYFTGKEH